MAGELPQARFFNRSGGHRYPRSISPESGLRLSRNLTPGQRAAIANEIRKQRSKIEMEKQLQEARKNKATKAKAVNKIVKPIRLKSKKTKEISGSVTVSEPEKSTKDNGISDINRIPEETRAKQQEKAKKPRPGKLKAKAKGETADAPKPKRQEKSSKG